jgi:hypothetical protein
MPLAEVSFDKIGFTARQLTKILYLPHREQEDSERGKRIVAILAACVCCTVYMKKPGGQFRH